MRFLLIKIIRFFYTPESTMPNRRIPRRKEVFHTRETLNPLYDCYSVIILSDSSKARIIEIKHDVFKRSLPYR